jgi:hypothetical protein
MSERWIGERANFETMGKEKQVAKQPSKMPNPCDQCGGEEWHAPGSRICKQNRARNEQDRTAIEAQVRLPTGEEAWWTVREQSRCIAWIQEYRRRSSNAFDPEFLILDIESGLNAEDEV